jgi:uncharacterized membrane-anchored protein YjiN (DUF445 family)
MELFILGVVLSGFFSWLFTHLYFKRSMRNQATEASREIATLQTLVSKTVETNRQSLLHKRIEESVDAWKNEGTAINVIDTYDDLSDQEKADLLDKVSLRVKGRLSKKNKYKATGS